MINEININTTDLINENINLINYIKENKINWSSYNSKFIFDDILYNVQYVGFMVITLKKAGKGNRKEIVFDLKEINLIIEQTKDNNTMNNYTDYDILFYTDEQINGKAKAIVEYDSSSNKPFMVYEITFINDEYTPYSGEDTLDKAIAVANWI